MVTVLQLTADQLTFINKCLQGNLVLVIFSRSAVGMAVATMQSAPEECSYDVVA